MEAAETIRLEHVGEPPRLIVVDTFARAMGKGNENEPTDMGAMIQVLDGIRQYSGACVVLIHHCGKEKNRGMRGHSSLLAAADAVIEVERSEAGRQFKILKSKDGADGEVFTFELDVVQLGTDEDGDPITSCVVKEGEAHYKAKRAVALTQRESGWLKHLRALFAEPDAAQPVYITSVLTQQFCLTREQVREGLKRKGRFSLDTDGKLTGADREKLRAALNDLQDKGKIGMTDKYVWLIAELQ